MTLTTRYDPTKTFRSHCSAVGVLRSSRPQDLARAMAKSVCRYA